VIEEILRVYGYNNIEFSQKLNASISNVDKFADYNVQNTVSNQLVSLGFYEMLANSLTTPAYISLSEQLHTAHNVEMLNPLSNDLAVLRQSLLFSGLEAVSYNINRKRSDLKFFEFGKTYHQYDNDRIENKHLSILVSGNKTNESWKTAQEKGDFFYLKGIIEGILDRLGIKKSKTSPVKNDLFSEGISYSLGKSKLVEFGIVRKSILKHFSISQDVLYADFNWDTILEFARRTKVKFNDIPKFPEVRRDFALLLDNQVTFDEIYTIAKQTEKQLLKDINLFDVYQGKNLPNGKKSYAVSFTLQDNHKTLTDKQIDKIMNKLQHNFENKLGAELR